MAEDTSDSDAGGLRRRPNTLIAAVGGGVVGAAVVGGVILAFVHTGGSSKSPSAPPSASTSAGPSASGSAAPSLTGVAAELVQQLTAGATVSYHARYSLTSPQSANKATVTLELWRRPPDVRQDTIVTTTTGTTDTAAFQGKSGVVECTKQSTGATPGEFACKRTSVAGLSSPQDLAAGAAAQLAGASVTKSTTTVAGHTASCFDLALSGATTQICIDARGIPLRIASAGSTMVLQSLDQTFASGVFTVPEAVS